MGHESLFSRQASAYARFRPGYPPELFRYLASLAPAHELAWDCATGSGQAAISLAAHFTRVIATDASAEQIAHAVPHPRVEYAVSPAERTDIPVGSVALIAVAQALHWFDLDAFYAEVHRVLQPGGVLAVWCYHLAEIEPIIDRILERYYSEVVRPYWSPRIQLIDDRYRTIPFPFDELTVPAFISETRWRLADVFGFLESWSATQEYARQRGNDPMDEIRNELTAAWGEPEAVRTVRWPLSLRAGRCRD